MNFIMTWSGDYDTKLQTCKRAYNNIAPRYNGANLDKNHKQARKDSLVFGGEGIVRIHKTPTGENRPVYSQCRDPASSLSPQSQLRWKTLHSSGWSGGGDRRDNCPAEHTAPLSNRPPSTRAGSLRRCPHTTAVTARHVERRRIMGK